MKTLSTSLLFLVAWLGLSSFQPTESVSSMVADWQRAKEFTQEYLEAMPADGLDYKPTPEIRSFKEQMLHLANGNFNFVSAASGKENPYKGKSLEKMDDLNSKEAVTKVVLESYDFAISSLSGASEAGMEAPIKLFGRDMTRGMAYAKAFEHQTHHRGQATIYIRMKGIKPPNEKLF
ncbi:DinB family protein [Persicitalea sp.]|uniref:DinB family protein n=1 Tax=Persicitalea sp. TaxID=3100273 RepID=UPI0035935ADA